MKVGNWELVGSEPYTRKSDGTVMTLLVWQSFCAECKRPIAARTPQDWQNSKALKTVRCGEHAKPFTFNAQISAKSSSLETLETPLNQGNKGAA